MTQGPHEEVKHYNNLTRLQDNLQEYGFEQSASGLWQRPIASEIQVNLGFAALVDSSGLHLVAEVNSPAISLHAPKINALRVVWREETWGVSGDRLEVLQAVPHNVPDCLAVLPNYDSNVRLGSAEQLTIWSNVSRRMDIERNERVAAIRQELGILGRLPIGQQLVASSFEMIADHPDLWLRQIVTERKGIRQTGQLIVALDQRARIQRLLQPYALFSDDVEVTGIQTLAGREAFSGVTFAREQLSIRAASGETAELVSFDL